MSTIESLSNINFYFTKNSILRKVNVFLYFKAKDRMKETSPLVEEDIKEARESSDVKPHDLSDSAFNMASESITSPKNLSGVHIVISEDNGKT